MKKMIMMATVAVLGTSGMMFITNETMAQAAPEVKTVSKDVAEWCTVTVPESAKIGDTVEIKVTLKNVKTPAKLICDLHNKKEGGAWGGYWLGGTAQDVVKADGTYTFSFTLTPKEGAVEVVTVIFLSPDGKWDNRTANIQCSFPLSK